MNKGKKFLFSVLCLALIFSLLPTIPAEAATTIYVPDDYPTIQAAVDAASPGDTIIVRDGTYTENVDVSKSLTIQSENGAEVTIVQAANPDDHVFEVTADYVEIRGLRVEGANEPAHLSAGIRLSNVKYCSVCHNIASNNYYGIALFFSSDNTLSGNTASSNGCGIWLYNSSSNTLSGNAIRLNDDGLKLSYSSDSTLTSNIMSDNYWNFNVIGHELSDFIHDIDTSNKVNGKPVRYLIDKKDFVIDSSWDVGYLGMVNCTNMLVKDLTLANNAHGVMLAYSSDSRIQNIHVSSSGAGIHLLYSSNNTLSGNIFSSNGHGIHLKYSSNNMLTSNTASNSYSGIDLERSSENTLTHNTVLNNDCGIRLGCSSNNTLTSNIANENSFGIYLRADSSTNKIYLNNFTDNDNNVYSTDSTNTWNSPEEITYTYNGKTYTSYVGNYWSDYAGGDTDGDGIGDSPYSINSDKDNYPLMEPFENYEIGLPPAKLLGEFNLTAYYCVYNSEIGGTQTYTKTIPDKRPGQTGKINLTLKASFWFGGKGVAMQGTGRTEAGGLYIKYEGGGGHWVKIGSPQWRQVEAKYHALGITDFTGFGGLALSNPQGARYSVREGVIGAADREVIPWYSIAAPANISLGTTGYIEFLTGETLMPPTTPDGKTWMQFRVDDRGGAIRGRRIDVYVGEGEESLSQWYNTGGNRRGLVYVFRFNSAKAGLGKDM